MKHFYYQLPMAFIFLSLSYISVLLLILGQVPHQQQHNHHVSCRPISLPNDSMQMHFRGKRDDEDDGDDDDGDNDKTTDSSAKKRGKDKDKESKGGDGDSGSKYDIKVIIFTGVMVAAVLFMAFFCFLGIWNLQCCCGALGGAVSGARIANKQREQQMQQQKQQSTSGSKTRKRGHFSFKSYPITIETDSSGGSSSSRRKGKNRAMVVTLVSKETG